MAAACIGGACLPSIGGEDEGSAGSGSDDDDSGNLMWFETEEEFFAAASRCAALYFLPERRVVFREKSLQPSSGGAECQSALYRVIQRGSEREILADNTGGALYDAAIVLSRYLAAREAESMQGKTVLELGCGPALVSMVSARLVGSSGYVCATDGEQSTVSLAAENLALIPERNTAAARFWWGTSPEDVSEMRSRSWDYIVASDVAYEPAVFGPLCEALIATSSSTSKVLLCNGVRSSRREKQLRRLLERHFKVEDVNVEAESFSLEEDEAAGADQESLEPRRFHRFIALWSLVRL